MFVSAPPFLAIDSRESDSLDAAADMLHAGGDSAIARGGS
jgi:hypothetical protein